MISGSFPPEVCGVGDYTSRVMDTSTAATWKLYRPRDWSPATFLQKIKDVNSSAAQVIFMQYPTQGYGWSLLPHALCVYYSLFSKRRFFVVLHEYSQLSPKSRSALGIMLRSASHVIFTSDFERESAVKRFARLATRSSVIKIRSNIASHLPSPAVGERPIDIVNFGHIRPKKGIETYIESIAHLKAVRGDVRAVLVGQSPAGFEDYLEQISERCLAVGIEIMLNRSDTEVAELLSSAKIAYLPFPDGVSERRGSALAAMSNGALVCTTSGRFTTASLERAMHVLAPDAQHAAVLNDLLNLTPAAQSELQQKGHDYLASDTPASWDDVAKKYLSISKIGVE